MMRRRGAPTLYELSQGGGRGSLVGSSSGLSGGSTPSFSSFSVESMRTVRVPLGFVWLLAIAVLGLAALAYAFGVGRGRAAGFAEGYSAKLSEDNTRAMARMVKDPMSDGSASVSVTPQKQLPSATSNSTSNTVTATKLPTQSDAKNNSKADSVTQPSATDSEDPRVKGLNYLTLARPTAEQSDKMLAFCRAEGLVAYLVLDNNAKLRKIIVLPALRSKSALETKEGQELLAKVRAVGQRWKAQSKGNRDFSDAYLELFR